MDVTGLTHLNEENTATKMIDDLLPAAQVPPFDRIVRLAACDDDPKGHGLFRDFLHLRHPLFLFLGEVNVPLESRRLNIEPELPVQIIDEAVNEMERSDVALMDQWILAFDLHHLAVRFRQRGKMWVICPNGRARSTHIRGKLAGIAQM